MGRPSCCSQVTPFPGCHPVSPLQTKPSPVASGQSWPYVLVCLAGPAETSVEEGASGNLGSRGLPTAHTHIQGTVLGTQPDSPESSNSTSNHLYKEILVKHLMLEPQFIPPELGE